MHHQKYIAAVCMHIFLRNSRSHEYRIRQLRRERRYVRVFSVVPTERGSRAAAAAVHWQLRKSRNRANFESKYERTCVCGLVQCGRGRSFELGKVMEFDASRDWRVLSDKPWAVPARGIYFELEIINSSVFSKLDA